MPLFLLPCCELEKCCDFFLAIKIILAVIKHVGFEKKEENCNCGADLGAEEGGWHPPRHRSWTRKCSLCFPYPGSGEGGDKQGESCHPSPCLLRGCRHPGEKRRLSAPSRGFFFEFPFRYRNCEKQHRLRVKTDISRLDAWLL